MAFYRLNMWNKNERWASDELERFYGLAQSDYLRALDSEQLDDNERDSILDEKLRIMDEIIDKMPKRLRKKYGRTD